MFLRGVYLKSAEKPLSGPYLAVRGPTNQAVIDAYRRLVSELSVRVGEVQSSLVRIQSILDGFVASDALDPDDLRALKAIGVDLEILRGLMMAAHSDSATVQ